MMSSHTRPLTALVRNGAARNRSTNERKMDEGHANRNEKTWAARRLSDGTSSRDIDLRGRFGGWKLSVGWTLGMCLFLFLKSA